MSKKFKIPCPTNIQLLKVYHELAVKKTLLRRDRGRKKEGERIELLLKTRPVRSLSGIVNVSVLMKPYPCPGKCIYCPTEKGIPKSYLSGEPAVERAKKLNYDPYLQVQKRIEMLNLEGHPTDKIDLRIIGGTWSFYPKNYQNWYIKKCFDACNQKGDRNLKMAQKINEKAEHRIIGISIETRPDFINEKEIMNLRKLGVTRVELGIQSIYDDVLRLNLRGHGIKETILATKLLKDAGFKICYQIMPNLLGSDLKRDQDMFEEIFKNQDFQPDYLKIYPCALVKEAPLYRWWKDGKYKPYSKEKLIDLIKKIKKKIPYYVRIQRITRDIPSQFIMAGGARISNLRQLLANDIEKEGWKCKCIRCREVKGEYSPREKLFLFREDYEASGGKEIFLSFENKNREKLFSLLRLRVPSQFFENKKHFLKVLNGTAIIREVQTFGQLVPVGEKQSAPQHKGLGKRLIKEAEKIVKKEFGSHPVKSAKGGAKQFNGINKISVIAGVGARDYFQKLGYRLKDKYMVRSF